MKQNIIFYLFIPPYFFSMKKLFEMWHVVGQLLHQWAERLLFFNKIIKSRSKPTFIEGSLRTDPEYDVFYKRLYKFLF